jgi:hypothetical protein
VDLFGIGTMLYQWGFYNLWPWKVAWWNMPDVEQVRGYC